MERRYQVFISSTFQDLKNARQEISQALLRANCFPAGMELFPAADEEQFEFIKTIIDQSDYYIIITAGRYGSIHPSTGLSYTEMEYDYAVTTGKPVIRLLYKDPFNQLKGEFIEQTDRGRKSLENFRRKLLQGSLVNFWEDPRELGMCVVFGLRDAEKRYPAPGWVSAKNFFVLDRKISREQKIILEFLKTEGPISLIHIQEEVDRGNIFSDKRDIKRAVVSLAEIGLIYQNFHWDTRVAGIAEDIWDQTWTLTDMGERVLEML